MYPITFGPDAPPQRLRMAAGPVHGYEVENGGRIRFPPRKRFDAVVVMCKGGAAGV
ncbi:MAG: hypothetical protein IPN20_15005 [Haliscomenobacter sp.]|nr:hypothetical protein [Haliscomenobacter sp.]